MFTGDGFSLNSGFTKILCTPEKPLPFSRSQDSLCVRHPWAGGHGSFSEPCLTISIVKLELSMFSVRPVSKLFLEYLYGPGSLTGLQHQWKYFPFFLWGTVIIAIGIKVIMHILLSAWFCFQTSLFYGAPLSHKRLLSPKACAPACPLHI